MELSEEPTAPTDAPEDNWPIISGAERPGLSAVSALGATGAGRVHALFEVEPRRSGPAVEDYRHAQVLRYFGFCFQKPRRKPSRWFGGRHAAIERK